MGYEWYPILRMSPENGSDVTINFRQEFTDANGPTKTHVGHSLERDLREDVNRSLRATYHGFRPEARLTLEILNMEDHQVLAQILERAVSPAWTLYLSLDGGDTEREVILTEYRGPKAIKRKTYLGAEYEIAFGAVDLSDEVPAIGEGTW